jgi:acetoacetyl-CoA reductase/3-oxoacyl-[acyl-carrier protein] reductase
MGRLDGKVALVTGASRGIGREIAIELAAEGAKVALNYQSSDERAQEVADEIAKFGGTCLLAKADVAHPEEARAMVKRVVDHFGRLDVLVNNAGITRDKSIRKMTDDDWLEVVQTNLNAVFFCTSAAIPVMVEQNYGRIINVSSLHGVVASPYKSAYISAKHGIIGFTKTIALELAEFGITANAICPAYVRTAIVEKQIADQTEAITKPPLSIYALQKRFRPRP